MTVSNGPLQLACSSRYIFRDSRSSKIKFSPLKESFFFFFIFIFILILQRTPLVREGSIRNLYAVIRCIVIVIGVSHVYKYTYIESIDS